MCICAPYKAIFVWICAQLFLIGQSSFEYVPYKVVDIFLTLIIIFKICKFIIFPKSCIDFRVSFSLMNLDQGLVGISFGHIFLIYGCAIGFGAVPDDLAMKTRRLRHGFGELADREVDARDQLGIF